MLQTLECQNANLRKLVLLWFGFILQNSQNKLQMAEKCGLGISEGKYFLTRTKYLKLNLKDEQSTKGFIRDMLKIDRKTKNQSSLFWYYDIKQYKKTQELKKRSFKISQIIFGNDDQLLLRNIPDPIYNLCGFDLGREDLVRENLYSTQTSLYSSDLQWKTQERAKTSYKDKSV